MKTDEIVEIFKSEFKGKDYVIFSDVAWEITILLSDEYDFDNTRDSISDSLSPIIHQLENIPELSVCITQTISTPTQIKTKATDIVFSKEV